MSNTPRTDTLEQKTDVWSPEAKLDHTIILCRQLETELEAAQKRIVELETIIAERTKAADELLDKCANVIKKVTEKDLQIAELEAENAALDKSRTYWANIASLKKQQLSELERVNMDKMAAPSNEQ